MAKTPIIVAVYLAAAVLANLLIAWLGPQATPYVAFALIGLDLSSRDLLHERWGRGGRAALVRRMGALVVGGSLLTAAVNVDATQIALASLVAFVLAGASDTVVYELMKQASAAKKMNVSNVAGAAMDSAVFPLIAFGAFDASLSGKQFAAKVVGGAMWAYFLARRKR